MSEGDDRSREESSPRDPNGFDPKRLDKSLISLPLMEEIKRWEDRVDDKEPLDVIIDVNLDWPDNGTGSQSGGSDGDGFAPQNNPRDAARSAVIQMIAQVTENGTGSVQMSKTNASRHYVFAKLLPDQIRNLASLDLRRSQDATPEKGVAAFRAIHRIWYDHDIKRYTNKSISTVKADAAKTAFGALGEKIVWAVLDTGVDGDHPHFKTHKTLDLELPLRHDDFTDSATGENNLKSALTDIDGHGTHVAGIIAGEFEAGPQAGLQTGRDDIADKPGVVLSKWHRFQEDGNSEPVEEPLEDITMSGMAPKAKILSLKVLDDNGNGKASNIIAALEYVNRLNSYGRLIKVQGVNLSVGYSFDPAWYACGQSPICVEVNRLVRMGVVVVTAAGNTGYGYNQPAASGPVTAGLNVTINDPGNAELAITVGSTHRDEPHTYGVSYFSSKGPTGDGRMKPDLVAPGEKIMSCETNRAKDIVQEIPFRGKRTKGVAARYIEDSGTSMAAPHVSGVIAAFLSIRREFIGDPLAVKKIFVESATDLNREIYFQGKGLVDLMRAIQSV